MDKEYLLAGDVGGTKTRLAIFSLSDTSLHRECVEQYESANYSNLETIVNAFLEQHKRPIRKACFGIPGPVINGRVNVTNLPWTLYDKDLAKGIHIDKVKLVNDLVATAAAIPMLSSEQVETLHQGSPQKGDGAYLVIAPGTGMGQAMLVEQDGIQMILPSEGGHADFAPRNELEFDLCTYLQKRYGHVSVERVLCGPGLVNIYEFLRDSGREDEPTELRAMLTNGVPAAVISNTAQDGNFSISRRALDIFVDILGAHAANVMITVMATKGVYFGGGVPPKILKKLKDGSIVKSFINKGAMSEQVKIAPLYVIKDDHAALLGAASIASKL